MSTFFVYTHVASLCSLSNFIPAFNRKSQTWFPRTHESELNTHFHRLYILLLEGKDSLMLNIDVVLVRYISDHGNPQLILPSVHWASPTFSWCGYVQHGNDWDLAWHHFNLITSFMWLMCFHSFFAHFIEQKCIRILKTYLRFAVSIKHFRFGIKIVWQKWDWCCRAAE